MSSPGLASIIRNSGFLLSARGLNVLVRAVYVAALAYLLGPELYGLFAYGTSWYLVLLPLTTLGLDLVVSREVGRRTAHAAHLVAQTLAIRIVAAVIAAIVSATAAWYLEEDPIARNLLLIFSVALIARAIATWSDGVFVAYERAKESFRLDLLFRPAEVVVGLTVLLSGGGVVAVAATHALTWWAHAVVSVSIAKPLIGNGRLRIFPGQGVLLLLRTGLPLGLVALMQTWMLNGPLVVFRQTGGSVLELGQLSLVLQALMVTSGLGVVISRAALPILSRAAGRGDSKDRLFAEEALRLSAGIGVAAWLIGTAWGGEVVGALFGTRYMEAGTLLGPTFALLYPFLAAVALAHVLIANQESWRLVWVSLLAALLMTGLEPWLQYSLGLSGVLLAMGIGFTAWLLGLASLLYLRGGIGVRRSLAEPLAVSLAAVVAYFGLATFSVPLAFFLLVVLLSIVLFLAVRRHLVGLQFLPSALPFGKGDSRARGDD